MDDVLQAFGSDNEVYRGQSRQGNNSFLMMESDRY